MQALNPLSEFPFLADRDPDSHKGDYGHALLVAGSYGKMGAAVLAARACLRSGVGLLTVHVPRRGVDIMQTAVPEAMLSIDVDDCRFTALPAHLERYSAIAFGPGLGTAEPTQSAVAALLERCAVHGGRPLAVDADGLNILGLHPEWLHLADGAVVTPHVKEYERLFGSNDPQGMADIHGLTIVKKAHRTRVYAPHVAPMENSTGNAGMATAGSGDVLTGIVLGLLAQHDAYASGHADALPSAANWKQQVAAAAVWLHGAAGDFAAASRHQFSIVASDIVEAIPFV